MIIRETPNGWAKEILTQMASLGGGVNEKALGEVRNVPPYQNHGETVPGTLGESAPAAGGVQWTEADLIAAETARAKRLSLTPAELAAKETGVLDQTNTDREAAVVAAQAEVANSLDDGGGASTTANDPEGAGKGDSEQGLDGDPTVELRPADAADEQSSADDGAAGLVTAGLVGAGTAAAAKELADDDAIVVEDAKASEFDPETGLPRIHDQATAEPDTFGEEPEGDSNELATAETGNVDNDVAHHERPSRGRRALAIGVLAVAAVGATFYAAMGAWYYHKTGTLPHYEGLSSLNPFNWGWSGRVDPNTANGVTSAQPTAPVGPGETPTPDPGSTPTPSETPPPVKPEPVVSAVEGQTPWQNFADTYGDSQAWTKMMEAGQAFEAAHPGSEFGTYVTENGGQAIYIKDAAGTLVDDWETITRLLAGVKG